MLSAMLTNWYVSFNYSKQMCFNTLKIKKFPGGQCSFSNWSPCETWSSLFQYSCRPVTRTTRHKLKHQQLLPPRVLRQPQPSKAHLQLCLLPFSRHRKESLLRRKSSHEAKQFTKVYVAPVMDRTCAEATRADPTCCVHRLCSMMSMVSSSAK